MKIGILSDFHIGYERFHDDAYRQAEEALGKAYEAADILLIAGDIFDYRHPKPEVAAEVMTLFRNLSRKKFDARVVGFEGDRQIYTDIPVIAIPGTHERRTENSVDPIDLLNLAGLLVNANKGRVIIEKKESGDAEKVAVYGVGGTAEERFKESLKQLNPLPHSGIFNVFVFHQSVYELLPFSEDFIRIDELPDGFDLYVDGHIHNKVELKCHGKPLLIPGSTVLTQLKEAEQDEKGFFVYDTKTNRYAFNRIGARRFFLVKINAEKKEPGKIRDEIEREIERIVANADAMPVIKLELRGRIQDGFKSADIDFKGIVGLYKEKATIELSKTGIDGKEFQYNGEEVRKGILENMPVKEYGALIFLEKLQQNRYGLEAKPSQLFEILSSDGKKEAVIKEALEVLFGS